MTLADDALRCALLGTTRVRCPGCEGAKVETKRVAADRTVVRGLKAKGWIVTHKGYGGGTRYTASRPCPTCTGPAVEEHHTGSHARRAPAQDDRREMVAAGWDCGEVYNQPQSHRWVFQASRTVPGKPTGHVARMLAEACKASRVK